MTNASSRQLIPSIRQRVPVLGGESPLARRRQQPYPGGAQSASLARNPFGHVAVAHLARRFLFPATGLPFLILASFGPDFVDKPAKFLFGASGHGVGHSLIFAFGLAGLAMAAAWGSRDGRRLVLVGLCAWLGHILCDAPILEAVLWPFLGPLPPNLQSMGDFATSVLDYYRHPDWNDPVVTAEAAVVAAAVAVWLGDCLQRFRRLLTARASA